MTNLNKRKSLILVFIFSMFMSGFFLFLFDFHTTTNILLGQVETGNNLNYIPCCSGKTSFYSYLTILFSKFTESFLLIRAFQLFFLILSTFFLSLEFYNFTKSKFFSSILFLSIMLNLKLVKICYFIYEDALYLPVFILTLAFLLKVVNQFSIKNITYFSIACGTLLSIKLTGISILIILVLLFIFCIKNIDRKFIFFMMALISFSVPILLENYIYFSYENKRESALIGTVSGKLPIISVNENPKSKYPKIYNYLYGESINFEKIISSQPNFFTKSFFQHELIATYQDFANKGESEPKSLQNLINENLSDDRTIQELIKDVFFDSLKVNKFKFFQITLNSYLSFWHLSEILSEKNFNSLKSFVDSELFNSLPKYNRYAFTASLNKTRINVPISTIVKTTAFFLNLITLILFFMSFYQYFLRKNKSNMSIIGIIIPIYVHAFYVSIAIIQVPFVRYFYAVWPALMVCLILFTLIFCKRIKNLNII